MTTNHKGGSLNTQGGKEVPRTAPKDCNDPHLTSNFELLQKNRFTGDAFFVTKEGRLLETVKVRDLFQALEEETVPLGALVIDGIVTTKVLLAAEKYSIPYVYGFAQTYVGSIPSVRVILG